MIRTVVALLVLLAAIVLGAPAPAAGETDGFVKFGTQWWHQTEPEAKFQEFRETPRGAFIDSYDLRSWRNRNLLLFYGTNALRNDQSNNLSWWNGAKVRVDLRYSQIPHNFSFISRSPYSEIDLGMMVLPDSLQQRNQQNPSNYAVRMADLLNSSPLAPMGFRTDLTKARIKGRPARGWQLGLDGTRRERSGRKPYGGAFGFNSAVEIWEPISQRMVDADARASYEREFKGGTGLRFEAKAGVSAFDNRVDAILWDNPKRITDQTYSSAYVAGDGTAHGQMDLYPDNRSVHGDLALGIQLPRRTSFSATVIARHDTQNDRWLPYTVNTAIAQPDTFPLPSTNTDAKATILTQDYRLTSRPMPGFGGTLRYRQYHYDNKTPEHDFAGHVRMDQVWEAIPSTSHPLSFRNRTMGVDLDWNTIRQATLGATFEWIRRDRTHREVTSDEEKAWSVQARFRPVGGVEASAKYRHGDRELDRFHEDDYQNAAGSFIEQPTLRRFDVANRVQDLATASLGWTPHERLSMLGTYSYLFNDYEESPLGLRNERQQNVSVEATYRPTARLDLRAGYGWGIVETDQHSRESGGTLVLADSTNWRARIKDWNAYVFGGMEYWIAPNKVSVSAMYEFQRSPGVYDLTNFKGTAQSLPGTRYRLQDAVFELGYMMDSATQISGRYGWEQWDVTDFASEDIPLVFPVTGSTNAIFLGDSVVDYRANRVALLVKRSF